MSSALKKPPRPLPVETLIAYDIDPALVQVWRTSVGPHLLPVQERAVKEFGLFGDGNLVVFSPTSSGKTFVGEMAAVRAARANKRVFYLVPQRALASEKFREFRARYSPVGLDVVVSSRDHREYDQQIRDRQFELAIVVFEKLRALLVSQPNILNDVGLVVVDELQVLTDRERGPTLELLLTKLRMAPSQPRVIGLSAVLGQAKLLTEWLGARLLMDESRPVELRKGVLCAGEYHYTEHNSGISGTEPFRDVFSKDRGQLMLTAAEDLIERKEQALLFVPDRKTAVALARALAERVQLPKAEDVLEDLREGEATMMRDELVLTLESSIAFHHADMTGDERELVERGFRSGTIRVLVATSTLAMGVNLPTKNVILDGRRWEPHGFYGRPDLLEVTKSEYENMSGRAGRLSFAHDFGRSILVTHSRYQAQDWLERYVGGTFEDIKPTLQANSLEDLALDLVASGLAKTADALAELLLASFTGWVHWAKQMDRDEFRKSVEKALRVSLDGGLMKRDEAGQLSPTKVGKVAAGRSIGAHTAAAFARWAAVPEDSPPMAIEVLTLLGQTVAGANVYVRYSWREDRDAEYKRELLSRIAMAELQDRPVFHPYTSTRMALEDDQAQAVKKALMLEDWIDEMPTRDIEQRYETWAGSLKRIGEEYGWLCESLSAICGACGWNAHARRTIERLGERLCHGVDEDAVPLARLRVPRLTRALISKLRWAGLVDPRDIRKAGPEAMKKHLGPKVVEALFAKLEEPKVQVRPKPVAPVQESAPVQDEPEQPEASLAEETVSAEPEVDLIIDMTVTKATLWGIEIPTRPPDNLKPQLFYALAALALRPGEIVSMADMAEDIQRLGRMPKKPVAPEARDIRYRINACLRSALEGNPKKADVKALLESIPGRGLRLNASAQVVLNRDELVP